MTEPVGKIEKPEAERFLLKRKLYLVPLIFSWKEAPSEYTEKFNLYWEQVSQHITNLESKIGLVKHIYHESIYTGGEEGLKIMERLNPASCKIARDKCQNGAVLEATEAEELVEESMDWERFLIIGFISQKVANMVSEFYIGTLKKRYEQIAKRINETLKENEAGLLFIREGHMVQFPNNIDVFSVAPPALDEIHRWQRDSSKTEEKSEPEK